MDVASVVQSMQTVLERVVPSFVSLRIDVPSDKYCVLLASEQLERLF